MKKNYNTPCFEEIRYNDADVLLESKLRDSYVLDGQKGGSEGINDLEDID